MQFFYTTLKFQELLDWRACKHFFKHSPEPLLIEHLAQNSCKEWSVPTLHYGCCYMVLEHQVISTHNAD